MKRKTIDLIRGFFGQLSVNELKALTQLDRMQLASAIARSEGLTSDHCDFEMVEY